MLELAEIKNRLEQKLGEFKEALRVQGQRQLWLEVERAKFPAFFDFAVKELGFSMLCTITGLDEGTQLGFIYHLAAENGVILNLKIKALKDTEAIQSITPYFPGAAIYERELIDLLGAKVEGLAEGRRYPLPDDWPQDQHPLRKDWNTQMLDQGVKI